MSLKSVLESVKLLNWATERVDTLSRWIKNKLKDRNEKKIDEMVDNLSDVDVERLVVRILEKREARRNKS